MEDKINESIIEGATKQPDQQGKKSDEGQQGQEGSSKEANHDSPHGLGLEAVGSQSVGDRGTSKGSNAACVGEGWASDGWVGAVGNQEGLSLLKPSCAVEGLGDKIDSKAAAAAAIPKITRVVSRLVLLCVFMYYTQVPVACTRCPQKARHSLQRARKEA